MWRGCCHSQMNTHHSFRSGSFPSASSRSTTTATQATSTLSLFHLMVRSVPLVAKTVLPCFGSSLTESTFTPWKLVMWSMHLFSAPLATGCALQLQAASRVSLLGQRLFMTNIASQSSILKASPSWMNSSLSLWALAKTLPTLNVSLSLGQPTAAPYLLATVTTRSASSLSDKRFECPTQLTCHHVCV